MNVSITSQSLEATDRLGAQLAGLLRPGDVIQLRGELGSGKTKLVRAIVAGLGLDGARVSSPTFVIANEYAGDEAPTVVHVDAYRLAGSDELDTIGWERIIDGSAIVLVEWPERIANAMPSESATISITQTGEHSRRFEIETPKSWKSRSGLLALATPPASRRGTVCPATGVPVEADCPTWPFANERARLSDLYQWMTGGYSISRDVQDADLEHGE
ncbi:MAG TPA: tRNA (adenosine(37)-N6)-threonylcarbamoyltransferase complex ATPase subunit type 1 TsaE [Phycisphaerales bacterium]|nr:tRNA (adenosine(37)-N6)-threonylcarbamoyltransferase complex ATPase subunit type 1 TsaE [Phycisphaerales bacterium]